MYWQETEKEKHGGWPDDVVDLLFPITSSYLPVDHVFALGQAVTQVLSWLPQEKGAGVHPVQVAISAHGWERPAGADDLLHLSKRTRLMIRVPRHRIADARSLVGCRLDIRGQPLTITAEPAVRRLLPHPTLYSRHVALDAEDEQGFLRSAAQELEMMDIVVRRMLPGKTAVLGTTEGSLTTRSLMVTDLTAEESIRLQQRGLGPCRYFGCGLFIPYKGIKSVSRQSQE
jgi:CRISPR-associated protein Cas6